MDLFRNFLLHTDWWVLAIGLAFLVRQAFLIWAAEQGRKQDLVKKLYKANQEFHLSVLVPYLNPRELPNLITLLSAIDEQQYPVTRVTVHVVTSQETAPDFDDPQVTQVLKANVKIWQYPVYKASFEDALSWLIERCLAGGGSGLFVFLKPTDLIKPDFFQNIVARGFDSFAIQGYVANKNQPESFVDKLRALSRRLTNRIDNAGRYHLGLSCRLLDSGWAIKQEVLEMIPFHRGRDLDNLEYTLRLNLENYRVSWAPNVVVYSDEERSFVDELTEGIGAAVNRMRMLAWYSPRLLTRALFRLDLAYLENAFAIVKPSVFFIGLVLLTLGLLSGFTPPEATLARPATWFFLAAGVLTIHMFSMLVSRCKPEDFLLSIFATPLVAAMSIISFPLAAVQYVSSMLIRRNAKRVDTSYKKRRATRFDETLEPVENMLSSEGPSKRVIEEILKGKPPNTEYTDIAAQEFDVGDTPSPTSFSKRGLVNPRLGVRKAVFSNSETQIGTQASIQSRQPLPREHIKAVPLSNGKNQVECLLKTVTTYDDEENEFYRLTLEYKSVSFSTAKYRILDQAYYELYTKLSSKGLTIITCGSCGYFYNPTADVPDAIRNAGVCLFGKMGKEVNLSTDAVTVLSQACDYHTQIDQREVIVQQWKDSVALAKVRTN